MFHRKVNASHAVGMGQKRTEEKQTMDAPQRKRLRADQQRCDGFFFSLKVKGDIFRWCLVAHRICVMYILENIIFFKDDPLQKNNIIIFVEVS